MSTEGINAPIALPEQGIVFICGEIDEELTAKAVLGIMANKTEELRVFISSEGGSVFDGMAIADAIRSARQRDVHVIGEVLSYCFSSANFILHACTVRRMRRESWMGIHGMTSGVMGDMRDLDADHAFNQRLVAQQARMLAEHSHHDVDFWSPILQTKTVRYFSAEEALEAGLVDEVV